MITLSDDMEVGVLEIDTQHMELVDRLNSLLSKEHYAVSKEEIQNTLDMLEEYIFKHFAIEEELQRENNYLEYESHIKMHELYIDEFQKLKNEFDANGHSPKFTMDLHTSFLCAAVGTAYSHHVS